MISDRVKRIKRYNEIVSLLVKNGYGYLVQEVGLSHFLSFKERITADFKHGDAKEAGSRLRTLLEDLGPTFIKIGQMLSIRSDLLPPEVILELEKLQDDVPAVPIQEIKEKLELELGVPPEKLFYSFNEDYVAAASIGQVHEAVLRSGEQVMVKIQRPGIRSQIYTDLDILEELSSLIENHYDWAKYNHLTEIMEELSFSIKKELDYIEEGRNTETVKLQFEEHELIKVPGIHWDYSTSQILTMECINGIKLTQLDDGGISEDNKRQLADTLVEAFVTQILREGFFHGDPHPGNFLYIKETAQLALIDFGQIGQLTPSKRYHVTTLMIGLMKEDTDAVVKAMYELTEVPSSIDHGQFYGDIDRIRKRFSHVPLGELNFGVTLNELFSTAQNHHIFIPKDFTMLGKTLMTIEGIVSDIDPSISMIEMARPHAEKLLLERYDPFKLGKRWLNKTEEVSGTIFSLPGQMKDVLKQASEGELRFQIGLADIKNILHKLDRISNQVSFSLTLLAFSIVVLGLIIGSTFGNETILASFPAIEIGFIIAFLMFLWIIYSILKTGRF